MNYAQKITIEHIANFIGLNRSYLCSLFKQQVNTSIQDYLVRYRINKACEMMGNAELSIGDISRSVGYNDSLLFSKIFKKVKGFSPNIIELKPMLKVKPTTGKRPLTNKKISQKNWLIS